MTPRLHVAGGAGFIGSHIVDAALAAGWTVEVLDDLSSGKRSNLPAGVPVHQLDVRSPEARALVASGRFDRLSVQAAQVDVRVSVRDPHRDLDINVLGLTNLLEGVTAGGITRVVWASSGGVLYGEAAQLPTAEDAPKRPVSPYGVSKLAGEHILRVLGTLRGFQTVALRYANVYGPRQDPHGEAGVCSIFGGRLLAGTPLTVFGTGRQTRDYVYVGDVARANFLALSATLSAMGDEHDARAFNIGTGVQTSVLDLVALIGRAAGVVPKVEHAPARAGELDRSALDASKAGRELTWKPAVALESGAKALIDWMRTEAR
jgi:UDP-glucose 4-epimerase